MKKKPVKQNERIRLTVVVKRIFRDRSIFACTCAVGGIVDGNAALRNSALQQRRYFFFSVLVFFFMFVSGTGELSVVVGYIFFYKACYQQLVNKKPGYAISPGIYQESLCVESGIKQYETGNMKIYLSLTQML